MTIAQAHTSERASLPSADARAANNANSLCYALSQAACPVALLIGDPAAAEHYAEVLLDQAARHALALWQAWCGCYRGILVIKRGDLLSLDLEVSELCNEFLVVRRVLDLEAFGIRAATSAAVFSARSSKARTRALRYCCTKSNLRDACSIGVGAFAHG